MKMKSCVQWNPLMIEKMSVSSRAHTLNRQISRPTVLTELLYALQEKNEISYDIRAD